MKRGMVLFLIFIVLILTPLSNAQLYSIQIKQVKINSNQLAILVESNLNKELYSLRFTITDTSNSKDTIISTIPLQAYTSNWYYITYSSNLKAPRTLLVEDLNQEYTSTYLFTSKEPSFIQEQVQIEQTPIQEPIVNPSKTSYIYSNNQLVAKKLNNQINYYHSDQISSTSIITDSSSNIVYKSDYYPFGSRFNEQGKELHTYTSKEQDKYSDLYYYGARYYDSSIGRFTQVDPIQDYSSSSYTYVDNNPLVKIDPSGMFGEPYSSATWNPNLDPGSGHACMRCHGPLAGNGQLDPNGLNALSGSLGLVPYLGSALGYGTVVTGKDLITKREEQGFWRWINLLPIGGALLGSVGDINKLSKVFKTVETSSDLAKGIRKTGQSLTLADVNLYLGKEDLLDFVVELSETGEHTIHLLPIGRRQHINYVRKILGLSEKEFLKNPRLSENFIGGSIHFVEGKASILFVGDSSMELALLKNAGDAGRASLGARNFNKANEVISEFLYSSTDVPISPDIVHSVFYKTLKPK